MKHAPLLPIDLDHVVAHELHLFLRIMDIVLGNIITQVVEMDVRTNRKNSDPLQGLNLQKLIKALQMCGVPFQMWKKRDDPSKLDWTSLGGAEKRKILSLLPAHFPASLPSECSQSIAQLWKVSKQSSFLLQD